MGPGPLRAGPIQQKRQLIVYYITESRLGVSGLSPTETVGDRRSETRHTYDWNEPRKCEVTDSNPQDPKESSSNTPFVAFGIIIGASLGTVVFAVTQNPVWIGIISGLGIVVGGVLQANRR